MDSFSDILQTIGAMIIFSLILLNSNRVIQSNSFQEVETEAEAIAIALAQNIIEEAQNKPFDAFTVDGDLPTDIKEDFTATGPGGPGDLNDFDDYDGYSEKVESEFGEDTFTLSAEVSYVTAADNYDIDKGSKTVPSNFKKMRVTVTSDYLDDNNRTIQLSYLRRYYKANN
jgi:signal peptidase I